MASGIKGWLSGDNRIGTGWTILESYISSIRQLSFSHLINRAVHKKWTKHMATKTLTQYLKNYIFAA